MAKYIDAEGVMRACFDSFVKTNNQVYKEIFALIEAVPAADVAEVNRCKTCFHYKPREYGYNCTVLDWDVNEDDFCSRWEVKDE